ncbi:hypothetical protein HDU67_005163 [Dinochytrium kinnereticum]|nr:hypothetical protein HDU67_005163 [Dinochytrium kinnereticum]
MTRSNIIVAPLRPRPQKIITSQPAPQLVQTQPNDHFADFSFDVGSNFLAKTTEDSLYSWSHHHLIQAGAPISPLDSPVYSTPLTSTPSSAGFQTPLTVAVPILPEYTQLPKRQASRRPSTSSNAVRRKASSPPPDLQDPELADTTGKSPEELRRLQIRRNLRRKLQLRVQQKEEAARDKTAMNHESPRNSVFQPYERVRTATPRSLTHATGKRQPEDPTAFQQRDKTRVTEVSKAILSSSMLGEHVGGVGPEEVQQFSANLAFGMQYGYPALSPLASINNPNHRNIGVYIVR